MRRYALEQFGPMALTVLHRWGITCTGDFGEIVFSMVEAGALGKTDEDRREDFDGGYDFYEAFAKPFLPKSVLDTMEKGAEQGAATAAGPAQRGKDAE
jgi:uncharacterized repeat protein (TIGR04138 family)